MESLSMLLFVFAEASKSTGVDRLMDDYGLAGLVMACLGYWIWKKDADFRDTVRAIVIEKDAIIAEERLENKRLNTICRDQNDKYTKEMNDLNKEFLDFFKGDDHGS